MALEGATFKDVQSRVLTAINLADTDPEIRSSLHKESVVIAIKNALRKKIKKEGSSPQGTLSPEKQIALYTKIMEYDLTALFEESPLADSAQKKEHAKNIATIYAAALKRQLAPLLEALTRQEEVMRHQKQTEQEALRKQEEKAKQEILAKREASERKKEKEKEREKEKKQRQKEKKVQAKQEEDLVLEEAKKKNLETVTIHINQALHAFESLTRILQSYSHHNKPEYSQAGNTHCIIVQESSPYHHLCCLQGNLSPEKTKIKEEVFDLIYAFAQKKEATLAGLTRLYQELLTTYCSREWTEGDIKEWLSSILSSLNFCYNTLRMSPFPKTLIEKIIHAEFNEAQRIVILICIRNISVSHSQNITFLPTHVSTPLTQEPIPFKPSYLEISRLQQFSPLHYDAERTCEGAIDTSEASSVHSIKGKNDSIFFRFHTPNAIPRDIPEPLYSQLIAKNIVQFHNTFFINPSYQQQYTDYIQNLISLIKAAESVDELKTALSRSTFEHLPLFQENSCSPRFLDNCRTIFGLPRDRMIQSLNVLLKNGYRTLQTVTMQYLTDIISDFNKHILTKGLYDF